MKHNSDINIENLIELASFELKDEEKHQLEKELDEFLGYAQIINNAPCRDMSPAGHAVEKKAYMRDDIDKKWDRLELLQDNSPGIQGTSYLVPPQKGTSEASGKNEK